MLASTAARMNMPITTAAAARSAAIRGLSGGSAGWPEPSTQIRTWLPAATSLITAREVEA